MKNNTKLLTLPPPEVLGSPQAFQTWFNNLPLDRQAIFMGYVVRMVNQVPLMKRDAFYEALGQRFYGRGALSGTEDTSKSFDWGGFASGFLSTAMDFGADVYNARKEAEYEKELKQMELMGQLQTKVVGGIFQKDVAKLQGQTAVEIERINNEAKLAAQAMRFPIYKAIGFSVAGVIVLVGGVIAWKVLRKK